MGLMRCLFVVLLVLSLAACGGPPALQSDPAAGLRKGTLVSPTGAPMSLFTFEQDAQEAAYILLGEAHTNACDHRVQADVLQALAREGHTIALGLEMVPAAKQAVLDRFNAGEIAVQDVPTALQWESIWGHSFSLYKPIFQIAAAEDIPVYALNIEQSLLDSVRDTGMQGLAPKQRQRLPQPILEPPQEQLDSLEQEFAGHEQMFAHAGNATNASLERFIRVQSIWDTQMAARARSVRANTGRTVVVLTGSGHVEYGWGIASRLRQWEPQAEVLGLLPWRGGVLPDPSAADAFFYCPLRHTSRLGFTMEMRPAGAEVVAVESGSRAAQGGLQVGDVLTRVEGEPFTGLWDLHQGAMQALQASRPMRVGVERNGKEREVAIGLAQPGEKKP